MTLSLLKNKDEFANLIIPAHPYTKHKIPDLDWVRVEHRKYSKSFADNNSDFDEFVAQANALFFYNHKSKSKLLKAVKMSDALYYFDFCLKNLSKSEKELGQLIQKMENSVNKSQTVDGFALGMRFKKSMDEIMADMTERQSKDLKSAINNFINASKYVHYELGLNEKFIPYENYFEVRKNEAGILRQVKLFSKFKIFN